MAADGAIRSAVLFNRSADRPSWPLARPPFSLEIARWISSAVVGIVSADGNPVKAEVVGDPLI